MLRSFYIASTGMLDQRRRMNVMTNNISNVGTVGFKKDTYVSKSFRDMLIQRVNETSLLGSDTEVGQQNTGVHLDEIVTCFDQGMLEETGRLLDFALEGSGFFAVSTPDGEMYTRDGCFSVNSDGYLVNSDGYYVLGENGRIFLGESEFTIDGEAGIFIDEESIDTLKIIAFEDETALRKTGDNLYENTGSALITNGETVVKQGYQETSNVDITEEIVGMMSLSRQYETNQRIVQMLDESLEKTVNEVGRV